MMYTGFVASRFLILSGFTLIIWALLLSKPAIGAPKPDAAVAPLSLFDKSSRAEKKIIYNRFEKQLSEHYRLLSSSQYKKARDKVFETVRSDQCTEKYCIRKIQETLQVERLFFLEITFHEDLTQLNITLIRVEDTLLEEHACKDCDLEQLYIIVGRMVDRIAARDLQPKTLPATVHPGIPKPGTDTLSLAESKTAQPGFLSTLSREEIIRHSAALAIIALSVWQSREEAATYNQLADRNSTISAEAAQADSETEYAALEAEYNDNQEQMDQHKTRILLYDTITVLALAWEGWQIYRTVNGSAQSSSPISQPGPAGHRLVLRPMVNPQCLSAGLSVSWKW